MRKIRIVSFVILTAAAFFSNELLAQNTLTKAEQKAGWKLLFDGKSAKGWHTYNNKTLGQGWKVAGGVLYLDSSVKEGRGDIVTDAVYENFELSLEWMIDSCGNSGIMYNVIEDAKYKTPWLTGPELQIIDNDCHPDAKHVKHRAGDFYDLIAANKETVKAHDWNEARIVSNKGKMEFWLNGNKSVEVTMHTPEWDALVAGSKFKSMPDFGKATKGHIVLQDHGDKVSFRNIKIREIK